MADWFEREPWYVIGLAFLAINVLTVLGSVVLWRAITGSTTDPRTRPIGRRDLVLTATTVAVNAAAALPAHWLVADGRIQLDDPSAPGILVDTMVLVVAVDLAMYGFHRLGHAPRLYPLVHEWHHRDSRVNALSLFVMHPLEPAGFALLLITLALLVDVSVAAVAALLALNVLVGTVAHTCRWCDRTASVVGGWLGGSRAHIGHHTHPSTNFAFFTRVSDRALRTDRPGGRDVRFAAAARGDQ